MKKDENTDIQADGTLRLRIRVITENRIFNLCLR